VAAVKEELSAQIAAHEEEVAQLHDDRRAEIESLEEHFQEEVSSLSFFPSAPDNQTEALREDASRRSGMHAAAIGVYEEELARAEQRFRARGPREEDARRLAELEALLVERERKIM